MTVPGAGGRPRRKVRLLDAWEDGRWLWRERGDAGPQVELLLTLLARMSAGLVVLSMGAAAVGAQMSDPVAAQGWAGAVAALLIVGLVLGGTAVAVEWVLRAEEGARAEEDQD